MNIVLINNLDNRGGAAKVAYSLKTGLSRYSHKASMFVAKKFSSDIDVFQIQKPNYFFRLIKKISGKDLSLVIRKWLNKFFHSDIDFFNISNLFISPQYKSADIIHAHNLSASFFNLSSLKRIGREKKLVWTLHDMWSITYGSPHTLSDEVQNGFFQVLDEKNNPYNSNLSTNKLYLESKKRQIYEKTNMHIVAPSMWLYNKVKKSVLSNKQLTLIHNGVDNEVFVRKNKLVARRNLNLPEDKKIIFFIADGGENNTVKGFEYVRHAIEHFANRNDVLFLAIGRRGNLAKHQSTEYIKYIDYINSDALLSEYYSASDIFLFTSLAENFPLVILEAMACGLPVVTFDVGGVKEAVIHGENGYISKYKDKDDLINGIEYVLNLPTIETEKISKNSIRRVAGNFSLDIMVKKYEQLYRSLIQNKNHA